MIRNVSMEKDNLFGKTLEELAEIVKNLKLPRFTAKQIADWLYKKPVSNIDEMTNLSLKTRELLKEKFSVGLLNYDQVQTSTDGTKKYLFPTLKGKFIEAAYIPEKNRNTLCVSTQVGCKMGCEFCMTGKQGFQGNLSAGEIINQVRSLPEKDLLTNIVYMGMGEPLDNLNEVLKSLEILTSDWGFAMSPGRITVSSIGIIPAMKILLEKSKCNFAISMHSPFEDERRQILPVESVHPIKEILQFLKDFDAGRRKISFEYIMFKDFNDTPRHSKELSRILNEIKCRINLIRFHPIPQSSLKGSDDNRIEEFRNSLVAKGIITTIRRSRGLDISAACGLLSTKASGNKS